MITFGYNKKKLEKNCPSLHKKITGQILCAIARPIPCEECDDDGQ